MNSSDIRLRDALRNMKALGPQGAPDALGTMLEDEFRRHFAQRSRERVTRIIAIAACGVAVASLSLLLRPRQQNKNAVIAVVQPSVKTPVQIATSPVEQEPPRSEVAKIRKPVARKNAAPAAARFVVLPTFDPVIPIDHLQMVRLELPGAALRLVGYPVAEEFAERRVLADVLFAQDGTPYALRFVQDSQMKERFQ